MKKILLLALAAAVVTACEKDPDLGKLSGDYLVHTSFDPNAFPKAAGTRVFVPGFVNELQRDGTMAEWSTGDAPDILDMFAAGLAEMGYDVVRPDDADQDDIDLNLSLSYVRDVTYYFTWFPNYWWWHYWDMGFWPQWYFPYPRWQVFRFAVASLTAELIVADDPGPGGDPDDFPVRWNVFIGGHDFGSKAGNTPSIQKGIPQAFAQSQYLQTES